MRSPPPADAEPSFHELPPALLCAARTGLEAFDAASRQEELRNGRGQREAARP